jgi:uncharacterized membrane protein (UPF0127 family)
LRTLRFREKARACFAVGLGLVLLTTACDPESLGAGNLLGAGSAPEAWVEIRDQRVAVELAESPADQALGLGQRDALPWDSGMLFLYERPAFYAFWMKGMRFSIDIVWIFKGRIVGIEPNIPFEKGGNGPTVRPSSLVDAVLEVPAGYSAARGWRIGDRVEVERRR